MKKLYLPFLLMAVVGLFSCGEETPCPEYWAVETDNPTLIAEVDEENDALSIQITNYAGTAGEIYQSYFVGDFDAIASFQNFTAPAAVGTNGRGYIEMVMYNTNFPDTILDTTAVRVGLSSTHLYAGIGAWDYTEKARISTNNSGTLQISKHGTTLTAIGVSGPDTVSITMVSALAPIRFGFRVGSIQDSAVTGMVGIKIPQFNVIGTNGTTLYSDDFNCNSLYQ